MISASGAKIPDWKIGVVEELKDLFLKYPVVGVADISEVPARQFQQLRRKLGDDMRIVVAKNTLIARAVDGVSSEKPKLSEIKKFLSGQVALVFSNVNPFKLNRILRENRVNAPARVGSISSKDVVIPAGETDFSPGPMVAELQRVGLKARIQAGKVVILEECRLLKAGDVITKEISDTLAKFGILPVELGARMKAAYEDGLTFSGEVLDYDEAKAVEQLRAAWTSSFNLALNIEYPTGETVSLLLAKAHSRAICLAVAEHLPVGEVMHWVLAEAHRKMLSLAFSAGGRNSKALDPELSGMLGMATEDVKKEEAEEKKQEVEGGQQN
ncbi:MAG: 50S ribosomal protein L10 [Candidatus Hadarchaeales archaeon]